MQEVQILNVIVKEDIIYTEVLFFLDLSLQAFLILDFVKYCWKEKAFSFCGLIFTLQFPILHLICFYFNYQYNKKCFWSEPILNQNIRCSPLFSATFVLKKQMKHIMNSWTLTISKPGFYFTQALMLQGKLASFNWNIHSKGLLAIAFWRIGLI